MKIRRTVATAGAPPPRGFPRWAWWTVFLATFTFVAPLTSPWWSKVLRSEVPGSPEDEPDDPAAPLNDSAAREAPVAPGSAFRVILHTRVKDKPGLVTIEREIPFVRGVVLQISAAVAELGVPSTDGAALLPEGTRVLDVAFSQGGTAYIDFSSELDLGRGVGAEEEKVLVQGIVNTVVDNFSAVRRIVILVDGKAPRSGHLDLSRPLRKDDPILAAEEPEPAPSSPVPPDEGRPKGPTAPAPAKPQPTSPIALPPISRSG